MWIVAILVFIITIFVKDKIVLRYNKLKRKEIKVKQWDWSIFLEEIKKRKDLFKVKDLANVEVGITTGANDFFTVKKIKK